jgi:hypothetical protein
MYPFPIPVAARFKGGSAAVRFLRMGVPIPPGSWIFVSCEYFVWVLLIHYYEGDEIEKNEMGGAYSSDGEERGLYRVFWWVALRERDHWGDPDVDGWIILTWIFCK